MPLPNNWYHLNGTLADVSAASGFRFTVPQAGYLRQVKTHLGAAITGADAVVTVSVDGTNLAPTITIANTSSAEGDVDGAEYFAPVNAGSRVEVTSDGASSTTAELAITLTLSR
jgi:hypothetical protein